MQARARLRVERDGSGASVTADHHDAPPVAFRRCVDGVYYLVATAAAPLGCDEVAIEVEVGEGAHAVVRAVGATVAYASRAARLSTRISLREGAVLDWQLGPLIATARCALDVCAELELAERASLRFCEELVLGRHGEQPGRLDHLLSVERAGRPLLCHALAIGQGAPGWDGPAVLGDARALSMVLSADPTRPATSDHGTGWARLALEAGGELAFALGRDLAEARDRLERGVPHAVEALW